MRLRVRRPQPLVAPSEQLSFGTVVLKGPRLRVRAKQLALPHVPDPVVVVGRAKESLWDADLAAVQERRLKFDVLVKRHGSLIRLLTRSWASRCPAHVGPDDLFQEAVLESWEAIEAWDPARGVPLPKYVRLRIRYRLHAYTDKLKRGREKDTRFLLQQIIEERVIVSNKANGEVYEAVGESLYETGRLAKRTAALVVGGLPSKQANVVAGLLNGEASEAVANRVYGSCKRQRKAALRAIAAATALVSSSAAGGPKPTNAQRTEDHATFEITAEESSFVTAAGARRRKRLQQEVDSTASAGQGH